MPKPVINPIVNKPLKTFKTSMPQRTPKQTSHLFKKGWKGGPGRPKGSIDKAVLEIRKFSQKLFGGLFRDKKFKAALRDRIMRGKESPQVMALLLAYGFGRPPEQLIVSNPDGSALDGAARREELIDRLCNRFAPIVVSGSAEAGVQAPHDGGTGGPVLELEGHCEAEPAASSRELDNVADSGRERIRENTDGSGDGSRVG